MSRYLLALDDVNAIDHDHDDLVLKVNAFFGSSCIAYRPLPFVDHTGFTETVEEEIEFVVGCQQFENAAFQGVGAFIQEWGFERFLKYKVVDLSGGWRKFLSIALFTNQLRTPRFYIDVASHLGDDRLTHLMRHLDQRPEEVAVFCEYDCLLLSGLHKDFGILYDSGTRIEALPSFPSRPVDSLQANYEHA